MIDPANYVFQFGGNDPIAKVQVKTPFTVYTEDAFSGKLVSIDGKPRQLAPFPNVNPLTGPIEIEGASNGDIVAVHILEMIPGRDWGVSTISPNFGLLSSNPLSPNLQSEQKEYVWIWNFNNKRSSLVTQSSNGISMTAKYTPFFGTIGVAPSYGEIRLGVVPGDFGGNLDLADVGPGVTLYLRSNIEGAHLYLGDGHYAQGDGEITGTAIEGSFNSSVIVDVLKSEELISWPRFESDSHIGVVGCTRPLDDAVKISVTELVDWVARITDLNQADSHQLVSQNCTLRIGNMVNPQFSVMCLIPKIALGDHISIYSNVHQTLSIKK